jgi:excisionase family DNA binding protein
MASPDPGTRFLTLVDVAEVLNTSSAQVYALVRGGDLPAIKIGGRGQWRVEADELEKYIARMYEQTRDFVSTHRFGRADDTADDTADGDGDGDGNTDGNGGNGGDVTNSDRDGKGSGAKRR